MIDTTAVAAIPEVLPVVVTISLAVDMKNMAKKNTIVRNPSTVETVGSISVICSDKTGTITENKMTVKVIHPIIDFSNTAVDLKISAEKNLLFLFYLASTLEGEESLTSNPTEKAIKQAVANCFSEAEITELLNEFRKVDELPFDSNRKRMTSIYKYKEKYIAITKGAYDHLEFSAKKRKEDFQIHDSLANQAYRILAVGYKVLKSHPDSYTHSYLEKELTFAGFIGMIDPPRKESGQAVKTAKKAGIRTVMITGDHLLTAKRIAEDIGVLTSEAKLMTGVELSNISDEELPKIINNYRVFARTSPEDKIRIVKAFQQNGEIVAMTGDGVNDAPALKAADVGIAMGGGGTEVAKEAADMILVDDHFATIIHAIEEGRRVYSNIRKSLYAMLGCNLSALTIVLFSLIAGWGAPVTAIQLLMIKIIADGIPGFSLSVEPKEQDNMSKAPISRTVSIFSDGLLRKIIDISIIFTVVTVGIILVGQTQSQMVSHTMTFMVLGMTTIVYMYNCRSKQSIFKHSFFSNPMLVITTGISACILLAMVLIPQAQKIFGFAPISLSQWFLVGYISIIPLVYIEIKKFFNFF